MREGKNCKKKAERPQGPSARNTKNDLTVSFASTSHVGE